MKTRKMFLLVWAVLFLVGFSYTTGAVLVALQLDRYWAKTPTTTDAVAFAGALNVKNPVVFCVFSDDDTARCIVNGSNFSGSLEVECDGSICREKTPQ